MRNVLLISTALLITVGTGLVARSWLDSRRPPETVQSAPVAPATYVLVAESDIPTGSFIKDSHLRWQAWPDEPLPDSYLVKGRNGESDPNGDPNLVGAVVRRGLAAGEPITKGRFIKPGDRGFLAAVLRPGYRAMAIQVNATSSIAGLIFPGDRVDLILTHTVVRAGTKRKASETVLTNVRVLAIDQQVDDQTEEPKLGKNVTLELSPKQAEMLAVSNELGRLSLSLHSLAKDQAELNRLADSDDPLAEPDPTRGKTHTWDTEVSRLLTGPRRSGRSRANPQQDVIQVSRGNRTTVLKVGAGNQLQAIHRTESNQDETQSQKNETQKVQVEIVAAPQPGDKGGKSKK
ncbi:MAG: Flp pilus assembly protein CpaB [Kiloniellaceae bacterium]